MSVRGAHLRTHSSHLIAHRGQDGVNPSSLFLLKGRRQNLLNGFDEDETHFIANLLRDFLQVLLVGLRQNDPPDTGSSRCQDLFLDPAHWQHKPAQADLAGHRRIASDRYVEIT